MSFDDYDDDPTAKAFNSINKYREKHGVEQLVYNDKLCLIAQAHAAKLADGDMLYHSWRRNKEGCRLGENIAMIYGYKSPAETVCKMWYDRIQKHDFDLNETQLESAYFSQVNLFFLSQITQIQVFFC
jgi:hypothetical protein